MQISAPFLFALIIQGWFINEWLSIDRKYELLLVNKINISFINDNNNMERYLMNEWIFVDDGIILTQFTQDKAKNLFFFDSLQFNTFAF